MTELQICDKLFEFGYASDYRIGTTPLGKLGTKPQNDLFVLTDDAEIDLSSYSTEKLEQIYHMFSGFRGRIKYPKFKSISGHHLVSERDFIEDDMTEFLNKVISKPHEGILMRNITFQRITSSDFCKIIYCMEDCRINILQIDDDKSLQKILTEYDSSINRNIFIDRLVYIYDDEIKIFAENIQLDLPTDISFLAEELEYIGGKI